MAASAFSAASVDNPGGIRLRLVTVTPSTSYPTGGEAMTAAQAGFGATGSIIAAAPAVSLATGVVWTWTGSKWKAYGSNGAAPAVLAEIANTTDLSASPFVAIVIGTT